MLVKYYFSEQAMAEKMRAGAGGGAETPEENWLAYRRSNPTTPFYRHRERRSPASDNADNQVRPTLNLRFTR